MAQSTLPEGYQDYQGLLLHDKTPIEAANVLAAYSDSGIRLRIYYGDTQTGEDYQEENETIGYVEKSGEFVSLRHNKRSEHATSIMSDIIVRIACANGKKDLYRHPTYHAPDLQIITFAESGQTFDNTYFEFTHTVLQNGEVLANLRSLNKAQWLVNHLL